ncbi:MAG: tryptophan synthase subunit alpha [Gammaproteobacteria bacterium]|nr:tryptophan synthase subunit alpha [Gammaproteobacteria bacterium]MBT8152287.1 tryptophan synthase subunit alpha [Gammaproteobacteria bacterium]NND38041.1 tryptophan synthase subunit alpha [Pseudomonadales bacterium]NNM10638.1 tryptophan synthase subunit alpha [Pseudomonadales bacterium]RZV59484.1 MAG: tryptophan synthase subunit alpha [Pseudomonadales bacterium]
MSRIKKTLRQLKQNGRKAVVPYIVAGDPGIESTLPLMHALVEAGADIIELGVPFSDPMAEGPVIQLAHERALAQGVSLQQTLDTVAAFRRSDTQTPVVLMGYANPVEAFGYTRFATSAAAAGVDGILTVDMPPEEIGALNTALREQDIDSILLIAPTTTDQRIEKICAAASGYIYYVSLKGVTGAGHLDSASVAAKVARIRNASDLPVCVGFGIKDAASAKAVAAVADGVVVGSVLVDALASAAKQGASTEELTRVAAKLLKEIVNGAAAARGA